ncbi:hypothetical protein [Lentzea sp. NPDC051838]|uniref:hypothetical protein n=1 Tax=Lentzea sp. NPDC051838 TaxID=3154849 RepID=UPI00342755AA
MSVVLCPQVDRLEQEGTWQALTTVPLKFELHRNEIWFRESWRAAVDVLGDRALELFQRLAILTLKPDAVLARNEHAVLDYMRDNGFLPVHAETFWYNRSTTRELWRHQWNVATLDRIAVSDLVHYRTPAMTVFFLDTTDPLEIPAAPRLTRLKGSAFPVDREEWHLRERIGAPNRVMVQVHCPDEPADIVRELGVIFDEDGLRRVYRALGRALDAPRAVDLSADLEKIEADTEPVSLRIEPAVAAVREDLVRRARTASAAGRALESLDAAVNGGVLDWTDFRTALHTCGARIDDWATVLVGSHYIQHDLPDAITAIPETGRRRWLRGEGLMIR